MGRLDSSNIALDFGVVVRYLETVHTLGRGPDQQRNAAASLAMILGWWETGRTWLNAYLPYSNYP